MCVKSTWDEITTVLKYFIHYNNNYGFEKKKKKKEKWTWPMEKSIDKGKLKDSKRLEEETGEK